jgi:redox-sensitive bicupin YhaK (pirin superfamily)
MLTIRRADDRGAARLGWLDSRFTFSFADYFDPAHMGFRSLRVINDDRIAPGGGFGMHPHRDMEIITHVLSGKLEHRDSLGNGSVIPAGGWQQMSAGTGVRHSEFNPSDSEPTHLLQIWIVPDEKGVTPRYAEWTPPTGSDVWLVAASKDGRAGSMPIHRDATLLNATVRPGERLGHAFAPGRGGWLHVATGAVTVNGLPLAAGDGLAVEGEPRIDVTGVEAGEVLLFDLA